ncbi:MAG: 2-C-methyl-D-erythritol 2,4-cyclodiphosphate synthase [Glaciecola sp.]|jgi:2-C-methyl-D-erythritol 2,4-cyclodiphosphate synthase
MSIRIGQGIDVHAFAGGEDRALVLGGVTVSATGGLAGHSDADAPVHAVADALLGAASLGDLGDRFGVDRPEMEGADSLGMLAAVVTDVASAGWAVGNVDVTIVAQGPRLAPHRDQMRDNLARTLGIDRGAMSVKFTTTDQLGTIGRGEGIAAWAVATLVEAS